MAKTRLFYTQGDYGLFQCSGPCRQETYDNEAAVRADACASQKDLRDPHRSWSPSARTAARPMTMNLRCDDTFVEDVGWHAAAERYANFLRTRAGQKILFLELGVGDNTPGIIKYPFRRMAEENPNAVYASINLDEDAPAYLGPRRSSPAPTSAPRCSPCNKPRFPSNQEAGVRCTHQFYQTDACVRTQARSAS